MATNKRRRVDDDENATAAASDGTMVPPTTPATTTSAGGGTPGGVKVKPGDSSGSEGTLVGTNVPVGKQSETNAVAATKKRRVGWNQEATALGYEAGTIKNSAFVLLAQSGTAGMTVAAIVDAATKQGYVLWADFFDIATRRLHFRKRNVLFQKRFFPLFCFIFLPIL